MNRIRFGVSTCFAAAAFAASATLAAQGQRFEVTVTNLTRGQQFTPILVASHQKGVNLFTLGGPATQELEIVAEDGTVGPLRDLLLASPAVKDVTDSGALLPPGASVTLGVQTRGNFDQISVVSMLIPTNDAFFAVNGIEGPEGNRTVTHFSPAYDAGTEPNDELCSEIPGPPCLGEGFNASREGAEGFVHIHAGIHGIGNLAPAMRDWRNPVAKITIRRVH